MPRSKSEVLGEHDEREAAKIEAEAAEPENVAARALSHRAQKDMSEFNDRLMERINKVAIEELEALLPHLSPIKKGHQVGWMFANSYEDDAPRIRDVIQGVLRFTWGAESGYDQLFVLSEDAEHRGKFRDFMLRERIRALAHGILAIEKAHEQKESVAKGCPEKPVDTGENWGEDIDSL